MEEYLYQVFTVFGDEEIDVRLVKEKLTAEILQGIGNQAMDEFVGEAEANVNYLFRIQKFSSPPTPGIWHNISVDQQTLDEEVEPTAKIRILVKPRVMVVVQQPAAATSTPPPLSVTPPALPTVPAQPLVAAPDTGLEPEATEEPEPEATDEQEDESPKDRYANYRFKANEGYDVHGFLRSPGSKWKALVVKNLKKNLPLKEETYWRRALVRECGKWLMEKLARVHRTPSPYEKAKMAHSIYQEYPFLDESPNRPVPYVALYDPVSNTGYLEFTVGCRRKTLKCTRITCRSKKSDKTAKPVITTEEGAENLIRELKESMIGSEAQKRTDKQKMDVLYEYRRKEILTANKTATEIVERYPKLVVYNELMAHEFDRIMEARQQSTAGVEAAWARLAPAVIREALQFSTNAVIEDIFQNFKIKFPVDPKNEAEVNEQLHALEQLTEDDECALALVLLPTMTLPEGSTKANKGSAKRLGALEALRHLIQFTQKRDAETPKELVARCKGQEIQQPFLLCLTEFSGGDDKYGADIVRMFLVIDHMAVEIPEKTIKTGLALLMGSFWVFNLSYPTCLSAVYSLLEMLFNLSGKPKSVPPISRQLATRITRQAQNDASMEID